jgi:hypothetical protein
LSYGGVGAYYEFGGRAFEFDGEGSFFAVYVEVVIVGGFFEGSLEAVEGFGGEGSELVIVHISG